MPGGPDYPLDTSQRFTLAKRNDIKTPMARTEVQGIIHAPSGDINNWVTAQSVAEVRRQMVTALAYLDVADLVQDKISTAVARVADAVGRLNTAVASQSHLLEQVAGFLGVVVPAWVTLEEVENGDDMGISRPSANELGLKTEIVALQREPGFGHGDVVSIDPIAGTFVARGTVVRVSVNFEG
jgi:hypothetical protein